MITGRDEGGWEESAIGDAAESLGVQLECHSELGDLAHAASHWLRAAGEQWAAGLDRSAVESIGRAWEIVGMAKGLAAAEGPERERLRAEAMSDIARKGAHAKHEENRAMKQQVVDHYLANRVRYPSKDAAAEDMANRLVPVQFRTVRKWLGGLPPAGTA